jgi:AraC-like DNA-binding protein
MEGTFHVAGVTCMTRAASYAGIRETEVHLSRHAFMCVLEGSREELAEETWDGRRSAPRRLTGHDGSWVIPREHRLTIQAKGMQSIRYLHCEIEHSAFERTMGTLGDFELQPHGGENRIAFGVAQRLERLCQAQGNAPLAYAEAVATVFLVELFRAHASRATVPALTTSAGSVRFDLVRDFIEEYLDREIGLFELAALVGLNATEFSKAFKAAHHAALGRYIMERRIERAKILLRTSDDTVAAVAACVGFSSQSNFAQAFAKFTGSTPFAYRAASS